MSKTSKALPFPKHVHDVIDTAMENVKLNNVPVNVAMNTIIDVLLNAKIAYMQQISTDLILVHKGNRGGRLFDPLKAHANGRKIYKVGANLRFLGQSMAFELPSMGPARDSHIEANKKMSEMYPDLVPPPNGQERYVSVASSHTVSFCRAANAGCVTNEVEIAKTDKGKATIDLHKLKEQADFKTMLESGWSWIVIPAGVEEHWPEIPDHFQRACNSNHGVVSEQTELEVALGIGNFRDMDRTGGDAWPQYVAAATAAEPKCKAYAETLGDMVKYLGGVGCVEIKRLDRLAKTFSCNAVLGEKNLKAVFNLKLGPLHSAFECQRIRLAIITCMMASPKMTESGLACNLPPVLLKHFERNLTKSMEVENDFKHIHKIVVPALVAGGCIDNSVAEGIEAVYQLRTVNTIAGIKKDLSFEKRVFNNYEDVRAAFITELRNACSCDHQTFAIHFEKVSYLDAPTDAPADGHAPAAEHAETNTNAPRALDAHAPDLCARGEKGFGLGNVACLKKIDGNGTKKQYYDIIAFDDTAQTFTLRMRSCFEDHQETKVVPLATMVSDWLGLDANKAPPVAAILDPSVWMPKLIETKEIDETLAMEEKKIKLYTAINAKWFELKLQMQSVASGIHVTCIDNVKVKLFAKTDFKANEIKLVPRLTCVSDLREKPSMVYGSVDGVKLYVQRLTPKNIEKVDDLNLFNFPSVTKDRPKATLVVKTINVDGMSVPLICNPKKVRALQELCLYDNSPTRSDVEQGPKKKARTS